MSKPTLEELQAELLKMTEAQKVIDLELETAKIDAFEYQKVLDVVNAAKSKLAASTSELAVLKGETKIVPTFQSIVTSSGSVQSVWKKTAAVIVKKNEKKTRPDTPLSWASDSSDEEDDVPEKKIAHKKARILDENEEVKPVPTNTYASRLLAPAPPKVENPKVKFLEEVKVKEPEPEPVVTRICTKEEQEEIKNLVKKAMSAKCSWDESSSDEEDSDEEEEEEEKPVIPQAPKVLKPIVLKSVKPVVEKIKEEDMPIIRKGPKVEVKPAPAPRPAPKPAPAPAPKPTPVPVKKDMIQIELKDAWSDDEN